MIKKVDVANRAALLIGVPSYDSALFEGIPHVVAADIRRVSDALLQSGYEITRCGVDGGEGDTATFNRISGAIKKALREAPPGGTLVVYYSGHGITVDGRSYLVPRDAYGAPSGVDPDSLVPLVPRSLEECRARLVVFFVDACRNDLSGSADLPLGGELPYPPDGAFVMVNSCSPGQRSVYGDDGSYFTQALAEALDRRSPARTLDEVTAAVTKWLARRSALSDDVDQTARVVFSQSDMSGFAAGSSVVCEGEVVTESWRTAVESTPLWRRSDTDEAGIATTRDAVLAVVDACAVHWLDARGQLADKAALADPWSTPDYPVRVLTRLHELLPDDVRLTAAELASAVVAPFLREVALGAGLVLAAGIRPQDFSRTYSDRARSDLEITHDMHEHVWRRAEGLARRGRLEARDTLAMWLVHRWLAGRASIWSNDAVTRLIEQIGTAVSSGSGLTERELCGHLRTLVLCVDGDHDDETLITKLRAGAFERRFRTLGALLWLAGILSADSRRMPSVIVDHVGVTDELSLVALHKAVREMDWVRTGEEMALKSVCVHPALFTVFQGVAMRAARVRKALMDIDLQPELARHLPTTITDAELRPEKVDGVPAFETPILMFRLSDEKVRELLMGRQLYGEPDLAIRELYQNALDACRYRWTRREYRQRIHRDVVPWTGTIRIRQDVDNGRPFIECTDNGVGMSAETLKNTFANAGERFIYRPAFRAEYARWQDLDQPLDLVPNSQFGVGVFSYFMIAEEIVIWTWPTSEDDVPEPHGHCVRIASSGSLFQITPADRPAGGGTVVRLYLTGDDSVSALKTMRRLLRVAEFTVTVAEAEGSSETWEPEQLRYPGASVAPLRHGDDFWWVTGEGGLAADGIRTDEERFGFLVNLRGRRRPRFTVDRNRLRGWDREWIDEQVSASLPALATWRGLTFNWLWSVSENTPQIGEKIFDWLMEHDRELSLEGSWAHGATPPARRIGCLPVDRLLFSGELNGWEGGFQWLTAWRTAVWRGFARFDFMDHIATPQSVDGFPVVRPVDGAVIGKLHAAGWFSSSRNGRPSVSDLLEAAADEEESPSVRLHRLRRFAIVGLDLSAMREIPPVLHRFHYDDPQPGQDLENRHLLMAVAAWSRPGEAPKRGIGGWLALASMRLHAPLDEVIKRAAKLVPQDWVPPDAAAIATLGHDVFDATDVEMLSPSSHLSGPPWIAADVPPSQIIRTGTRHGKSVPEVLARFDRFVSLGYTVMGRDRFPGDLQPVEHGALLYVDEMETPLSTMHLVLLAYRYQMGVEAVREGLARLAEAGFLSLPDLHLEADIVPTDDEVDIINQQVFGYDVRIPGRRLQVGWTAFRSIANYIYRNDRASVNTRLEASRRLLILTDPRRPVTMPEILDLAYWTDLTVGDAIAFYRRLLPDTADLTRIPSAALHSPATCDQYEDVGALTNYQRVQTFQEDELTWALKPSDIAWAAGRARLSIPAVLDRLEPYRSLGAPIPTIDAQDRHDLESHTVDKFDVAMLETMDADGQDVPLERVMPLDLVQTAGKFGWTLAETRTRMARFEPLGLILDVPAEACDDGIVHWQDLLVLTTHLDGQAPVLRGVVDDAHLAAAAEEIGETVDEVRGRLGRYADLFGFSLAPALDDRTA